MDIRNWLNLWIEPILNSNIFIKAFFEFKI